MAEAQSKSRDGDVCRESLRGLPPEKRAAWLGFLRAHSAIVKGLDADLIANFGVPLSAFQVLFGVAQSEAGYLRMSDVAEQARLSPSRASRIVSELERRGLLERRACEGDTRVVYAAITEAGRDLASKLERAFDELERAAPIRVVIDLDECDFIDSTGLATILHAADRLRAGSSALRIACPEGHLRDLLRLTAIDQTIPVVGTRSEALAALGLD